MNIKSFIGSLGALASLALVSGACGDDKKGGGAITVDTVALEYGKAFCAQMMACAAPGNEDMNLFVLFANAAPDACAEVAARLVPAHFTDDLTSGRIVMDGAKLRTCFDAVADTCGADPTNVPVCSEALVGTVQTGGSCVDDLVCAGDAFCKRGDGDDDWKCPGTCQPRVARGQPCTDYSECSQSAGKTECDYENDVCKATPSPVAVAAGAECGWLMVEGSYVQHTCPAGHSCAWGDDGKSICTPVIPNGASCEGIGDCDLGALCQNRGDGPKCHPIAMATTAGAACNEEENPAESLVVCNRMLGLYCKDGTCASTDGKNGSVCDDELFLTCDAGLFCDREDSRTCKQLKPDNSACVDDHECQSDFCGEEGKCAAPMCGGT